MMRIHPEYEVQQNLKVTKIYFVLVDLMKQLNFEIALQVNV